MSSDLDRREMEERMGEDLAEGSNQATGQVYCDDE